MNDKIERALTNFEDKLGTVLVNFEDQINKLKTENELLKDENEKLHKACEYKQKEIDEFQWELNYRSERIKKLRDENAKLRECVEFYADTNNWNTKNGECDTYVEGVITGDDLYSPWGDQGIDAGGKRARQVLKELNKGKTK